MSEGNPGLTNLPPVKEVLPVQSLFKELKDHGGMYPGLGVTIEGATRAAIQSKDDTTKSQACEALGGGVTLLQSYS